MTGRCDMGVGCDEAGSCWADSQGQPERCPLNDPDPSTYSEAALRGLLDPYHCAASDWLAARESGLCFSVWVGGPRQRHMRLTPRGSRLLAKAQAEANALTDVEADLLRHFGTPMSRLVSALYERGKGIR